jgi:cytochrome P450
MVKYPDVQAKAQAELDAVIGRGQLPTFNDEGSLPYLNAVIKECMRWLVIAPMALPHVLTVDDEYKGFKLPAESIVIANSWFVCCRIFRVFQLSCIKPQGNPSQ